MACSKGRPTEQRGRTKEGDRSRSRRGHGTTKPKGWRMTGQSQVEIVVEGRKAATAVEVIEYI